jgi:nicotinamidase-related amidase
MPAITIDQRSALVLIDLQKGILALPTLLSQDDVKNRARRLAAAFRATALPVVRVKVAFSADGGDLPPGRALVPGPFTGTELDLQLRRRGVTQIVLAGISTSIGVESTARSAWENSYNLIFAEDAITDVDAASHTHAFTKIFPHLGEIATTQQIIDTLEGRSVGLEASPAAGGPITRTSRRSENAGI